MNKDIKRLYELQQAINNEEGISYDDIHFLQNHKEEIKGIGDIRLAEFAGIDEQEWNNLIAY